MLLMPDQESACIVPIFSFSTRTGDHRDLHSFPTRRSSDLPSGRASRGSCRSPTSRPPAATGCCSKARVVRPASRAGRRRRSEEHTSELQSRRDLVCRLLLEKKKAKDVMKLIKDNDVKYADL